jgi:lipoate-protein ligase B
MHLQHLHIRNPIPYIHSLRLQEALLEKHFAHKTLLRKDVSLKAVDSAIPQPTLITFQTQPTYTVGRRHLTANPLSPAQIEFLTGASSSADATKHTKSNDARLESSPEPENLATFYPSPRGGLLTYHAPGQLTAYLILNLRTHGLTPRCYIRLLENTIIRTCARHGVSNVMTTDDPGVWVAEKGSGQAKDRAIQSVVEACVAGSPSSVDTNSLRPTDRKICAIGVHVSRGITSHGLGLNVFDSPIDTNSTRKGLYTLPSSNIYTHDRQRQIEVAKLQDGDIPAPGYLSWGFSRIVACGLEGKSVTWLQREQETHNGATADKKTPVTSVRLDEVARSLAVEVAQSLKLEEDNIESISEEHVSGT